MLAVGQGRLTQGPGDSVGAADQFDHRIHGGIGGERQGIIGPGNPGQIDTPVLIGIAGGNGNDVDGSAGPAGNLVPMGLKNPDCPRADSAEPGNAHAQRGRHPPRARLPESRLSRLPAR